MTSRKRIETLWVRALLPLTGTGLVLGIVLELGGRHELAVWAWALPSVLVTVWLALSIIRDLVLGRAGVDIGRCLDADPPRVGKLLRSYTSA